MSGLFHIDSPAVVDIDAAALEEAGYPVYRATEDVFLVGEIPPQFVGGKISETFELTPEEKEEIAQVRERMERRMNRDSSQ